MNKNISKIIKLVIVNLITSIRIIGAFTLPIVYYKYGVGEAAVFILILFLSDSIDGLLARTLHVSTFFGSILDASSDKLLNAVSLIILGLEYNIMFGPLVIEIAILYTVYSTYRYGGNVQSTIIGKIKTFILDFLVVISYILLSLPTINLHYHLVFRLIGLTDFLIHIFGFIILIACLIALVDYMGKNKIARLNPKAIENKLKTKHKKTFKRIIHDLFDTEYYKQHRNESAIEQFYIK